MALQREALEMRRRLYAGVDQPDLASSLNNVGASLLALGDRVTGVALISEALDIRLDGAVIDATPIERFASSLASTSASLDRPRLWVPLHRSHDGSSLNPIYNSQCGVGSLLA